MSELLRAVMTERAMYSRPKWYSVDVGPSDEPNNGKVISSIFEVTRGTYFLVMAVTFQECLNPVAAGAPSIAGVINPSRRNCQLSLFDAATSYQYQSFPVHIQTIPYGFNSITDFDEYFVIPGDRVFGVSVNPLALSTSGQGDDPTQRAWNVCFAGIEYKFDKAIDLPAMQELAMAYRPPMMPKRSDFVPLL